MSSLILSLSHHHRSPTLLSSLTQHRHRSNKSYYNKFANLIEVDLPDNASPAADISGGVRKLEDVIHNIIVRRSAPDWLPFLPGSSYWVPPRKRRGPAGLMDIIGSLAGHTMRSEEETLALSSVRGWPSAAFYIQGSAPSRPVPVDVQVVEVKFQEDSENESQSEDDSDH